MYSIKLSFLKRIIVPILATALFTMASLMPNVISAKEKVPAANLLSMKLSELVGEEKSDHIVSLIEDSKKELELSFRKNPKREEAFKSIISDCIRLLDGVDYVPQACNNLFGAFPEVDRVFNYVIQVQLGDQQSRARFPREFNDILSGMICGLCPTATCVVRFCESF